MKKLTKREERIVRALEASWRNCHEVANIYKNKGNMEAYNEYISEANGIFSAICAIKYNDSLEALERIFLKDAK